MPLALDKLLTTLGYPLGLGLAVLAITIVLGLLGFRRITAAVVASSTTMMWIAAMPITAMWLIGSLESQYPARPVEDYPAVDAAIVLGGGIEQPSERNPYPDMQIAADRVLHAYRILKAGKARVILLSGGSVFNSEAGLSEADSLADILLSLGIERRRLIIENRSRNTYQNARQTAKLFREHRLTTGLLVTSSSHMPRALATFRKAGLDLEPAATDINADSYDDLPLPISLLPDAFSLMSTFEPRLP